MSNKKCVSNDGRETTYASKESVSWIGWCLVYCGAGITGVKLRSHKIKVALLIDVHMGALKGKIRVC